LNTNQLKLTKPKNNIEKAKKTAMNNKIRLTPLVNERDNEKKDGPLTEERVHALRKQMKARRYCMDEKTEIIFLVPLEDVSKYHYRLIQDYSLDEWK
jgi:hypothetical protein